MVGEEERRLPVHPTQQPKQRDNGTGQSNVNWDFPRETLQGAVTQYLSWIISFLSILLSQKPMKTHVPTAPSPRSRVSLGVSPPGQPLLLAQEDRVRSSSPFLAVRDFINLLWILFPYQASRLQY